MDSPRTGCQFFGHAWTTVGQLSRCAVCRKPGAHASTINRLIDKEKEA